MKYLYIDGDNIGLKIEKSFLDNDEKALSEINNIVKLTIDKISEYLKNKKFEIIFSGADGVISKGENIDITNLLQFIRGINEHITFSIGCGQSLKDAYVALRYAKSSNKNIAVDFLNNEFIVIKK